MEFCHAQQDQYRLYFARIITVGGINFLEATFPSQEDKERILKHDETRKWIKYENLEFYPSGHDEWTFPRNRILYKDLKRTELGSIDAIDEYFDMMHKKYGLRGIRMLKEKNKEDATIFIEGHFNENTDMDSMIKEIPQDEEGPWFVDETFFVEIKEYFYTTYKYYLPPEEDRAIEECDKSQSDDEIISNVSDLETMEPQEEVNSSKEKVKAEILLPAIKLIPKTEKSRPNPELILYREIPKVMNKEMIIARICEENDIEEYHMTTFINDLGKEVRYLKAQFKTEESRLHAFAKSASWKDQTWLISSMISLKLVMKTIWDIVYDKEIVTSQNLANTKLQRTKDEDISMKPSDAEIKLLNNELDRINSSCSTRMESIVEDDNEPDNNNKQKKN
ncbi:hypothetical protein RclHR1_04740005 [Rhizophagus clarus]|uniref:Uncharacterized protein n=1 Tax=Rhizophagus clarus TaxID=94130 RepID=A0A2Z6S1R1_9GLOM|nr:hypothetical protein RclHR1_04740005 [Rhizophagus clarus]